MNGSSLVCGGGGICLGGVGIRERVNNYPCLRGGGGFFSGTTVAEGEIFLAGAGAGAGVGGTLFCGGGSLAGTAFCVRFSTGAGGCRRPNCWLLQPIKKRWRKTTQNEVRHIVSDLPRWVFIGQSSRWRRRYLMQGEFLY